MENEFVSYEEALALKELGFDKPCLACYVDQKFKILDSVVLGYSSKRNNDYGTLSAPLFQQAFRWFREKYDTVADITIFDKGWLEKDKWCYQLRIHIPEDPNNYIVDMNEYKTYEEAELACLRKLIKIVKDDK